MGIEFANTQIYQRSLIQYVVRRGNMQPKVTTHPLNIYLPFKD